jgi:phage gpG-like protein
VTVRIALEGSKELQAALREASDDVREAAANAVKATGVKLRKDAVNSIKSGPASGRTYTHKFYRTKNGKLAQGEERVPHTASAPGQPPMADSGRLHNSITFDMIGPLTATVGTHIVYGLYLEYGTRAGPDGKGGIAPRPWLRPAAEKQRAQFHKRLEAAISGALR